MLPARPWQCRPSSSNRPLPPNRWSCARPAARDDVLREVLYEPFKKDTGFEIVTATANSSKLVAMVNSGRPEIDVVDITPITIKRLEQINGVEPIPTANSSTYSRDQPDRCAGRSGPSSTYATVIGTADTCRHQGTQVLGRVLGRQGLPRAPHSSGLEAQR